jgi:hypothetical protein
MKFEPMAFLLVAVPLLIAVIMGFKTPCNNTLFSILVFVDMFIVAAFLYQKIGVKFVEKIAAKEVDDECYEKLIEKLAILKGVCPCNKCCCSGEKNPK